MPLRVSIQAQGDAAEDLRRRLRFVESGKVEDAMGRGGQQYLQRHFGTLNSTRPNRLGGKRTNFYAQAARSTNYKASKGEVEVTVSGPIGVAQRYHGGPIVPVAKKYLTIPVHPLAHGRRAGEFTNLKMVFARVGGIARPIGLAVGIASEQTGKGKKGAKLRAPRGTMLFRLVKAVNQKGDATILPPDGEMLASVTRAAEQAIAANAAQNRT